MLFSVLILAMNKKELEISAQLAILKAQLRFAMDSQNWDHAEKMVSQFHSRAQMRSFRHIESHLYAAELSFHTRRWKRLAMQLYLALMAPYGTFQRRWFRNQSD